MVHHIHPGGLRIAGPRPGGPRMAGPGMAGPRMPVPMQPFQLAIFVPMEPAPDSNIIILLTFY